MTNRARSVSSAGDVNGDGFDDLIVGAPMAIDPNDGTFSGASFVVFGKTDGSAVDLSDVESDGTAGGFAINGVAAYDESGRSVSSAGDVNGDGFDDLIVGAPLAMPRMATLTPVRALWCLAKRMVSAVDLSDIENDARIAAGL